MDINKLREQIDQIDTDLVKLFNQRMEVAANVADYKKENNLPIFDPARERELLGKIADAADEETRVSLLALYNLILELSRTHQRQRNAPPSTLVNEVQNAIQSTPTLFPERAVVACQGVEGAFSQRACEKIFAQPDIVYVNTFDRVFSAVDSGLCHYGVLPLENSSAGSVNSIYALMMKHNFKIVRCVRVKVDHCLVAAHGVELDDIREIISHEQAINQCAEFLSKMPNVRVTTCTNTAEAARMVAESGRSDMAAICSRDAYLQYSLHLLDSSIQDQDNNYTRFICISKNLEIYPGADKTSLMMALPHKPGSLYNTISKFYALGINLVKLESRPIAQRDFEFMFYFDLATSIYSTQFIKMLADLDASGLEFRYLGTYREVL